MRSCEKITYKFIFRKLKNMVNIRKQKKRERQW